MLGNIAIEPFSGFGTPNYYVVVTWRLPTTYPNGPYLEGNNGYSLTAKAEITFQVQGVGQGITLLAFFPRATEDHHTDGVLLSEIADKANIWESNGLWYPVHNSYDPYDANIGTGHVFENPTWMALPTTDKYAKIIKLVYVFT